MLMRRGPLKRKRETPRRDLGRVQHERMKPRAKAAPTALEKVHMDRLVRMGCLVCAAPAEIHHVMKCPQKVRRRDHRFVAPLCSEHHRGPSGVHGLGSEAAFQDRWHIDLAAWAIAAWQETERLNAV